MPQITRNAYSSRSALPAVELYSTPQTIAAVPAAAQNAMGPAYAIGALYLFFLFSHATEFIDTTGRIHIMIILAFLCGFAAVASGTLPDAFKSKPGIALTLFTVFIVVGLPFSAWKGGSFKNFIEIWWKSYATFFLVACLVFNLRQMRRSLFVIGVATGGILYFAFKSLRTYDGDRVSVEYGSLGNSNDLAGALLMCLPVILYIVVDKKRSILIRLGFFAMAGFLLATVVKTGSRASLLVLPFMAALVFFRASAANKAKLVACCALVVCVLPFFVSKDLVARYKTTFTSQISSGMSDTASSAVQSTLARKALVSNAITLTLQHPVFGVGLGNFVFGSANLEMAKGHPALWYTCHNIFLLVSSETGVAGFIFFVCAIVFTGLTLRRLEKSSKNVPGLEDVPDMAFTLFMSLMVYVSCGMFNTNSYGMQLPALAGLAVALDRITRARLAQAHELRMQHFRAVIPVTPSKFANVAATSLSFR